MSILLGIFTFILVLISLFMVLIILMQRAKSDGGVGAALGGGMAEAAFGGESGNVLSKATTYATVAFFVLSFGLYLGHVYQNAQAKQQRPVGLPEAPAVLPGAPLELPALDPAAPPAAATEGAPAPAGETAPAPAPAADAASTPSGEAAPVAPTPEPTTTPASPSP
jgi:preprotein translocase subunit SecG